MIRKTLVLVCVILLIATASSAMAAVTTIDLTSAGATGSGSADIGGTFQVDQISPQSTGTGVIDPFLRIQMHGNEEGYNTSLFGMGVQPPLDDIAGNWTHALLLADIPIETIGGVDYRQFLLDVNQSSGGQGANQLLSLNQVQIFQSTGDRNDGTVSGESATTAPQLAFIGTPTTTEVFRINNSADDPNEFEILLDYALNSGSGSGDMFLYVRDDNFDALDGDYVIFYSHFGTPPGGSESNDGFEEWAVLKADNNGGGGGGGVIPEPASLLVWGLLGLVGVLAGRRRWA